MKRCFLLILALLLLSGTALAELDTRALEELPDMAVFPTDNGVDIVVRPLNQPFFGTCEDEEITVCAYIDYLEHADSGLVFLRLTVATTADHEIWAEELIVTVDKEQYAFPVHSRVDEYDQIFMEDYTVCLTDVSLPLLKALARSRKDTHPFTLQGSSTVAGTLTIPGDAAAALYDAYVNLMGNRQNLEMYREMWPCTVTKLK